MKSKKASDVSPRSGFFHNFKKKEVFVKKWNEELGTVVDVDELTFQNLQDTSNLKTLDPNLGPYPYDSYKQWCGLSNFVSGDVVKKLQVLECRNIASKKINLSAEKRSNRCHCQFCTRRR